MDMISIINTSTVVTKNRLIVCSRRVHNFIHYNMYVSVVFIYNLPSKKFDITQEIVCRSNDYIITCVNEGTSKCFTRYCDAHSLYCKLFYSVDSLGHHFTVFQRYYRLFTIFNSSEIIVIV